METPIAQPARQGSSILNFLVGLVCLSMTVAFGVIAAQSLGYLDVPGAAQPIPPPTPIIRVVAPAQSAPVEAPVRPAVVVPAAEQALPPAPVIEQATSAPARQIIIIKQADNPGAAPIVIDRGTKRRSP
jgi:hypothetical protein